MLPFSFELASFASYRFDRTAKDLGNLRAEFKLLLYSAQLTLVGTGDELLIYTVEVSSSGACPSTISPIVPESDRKARVSPILLPGCLKGP